MSRVPSLLARLSLAAAFASASLPAAAADFEFAVPVQLSKLDPAFTQGKVACEVRGMNHDAVTGLPTGQANALIGSGETTFAIAQGAFNGPVSVSFNANRPKSQPSDGRSWKCGLVLVAGNLSQSICYVDTVTGLPTGRAAPDWMKLDEKTIRGCAQGTIIAPK
jgi:hypothetical protein